MLILCSITLLNSLTGSTSTFANFPGLFYIDDFVYSVKKRILFLLERVNLVLVIPSWLKAEMLHTGFIFFILSKISIVATGKNR